MIISDIVFSFKGVEALRKFINKNIYEDFLKNLMVQIPGVSPKLESIENQSNSEGDFFDPETKSVYEATLLVNNNILSNIINNHDYLFSQRFYEKRFNDTMSMFIESLARKQDKMMTIVLFNIFPDIFSKFQNTTSEIFFLDKTDLIFEKIKMDYLNLICGKKIILVSYNDDNSFYARTLYQRNDDLVFIRDYNKAIFPFNVISKKISIDTSI